MATTPKAGTVVVPYPAIRGQEFTLHKENTYSGILFYLGSDYQALLETAGVTVKFTVKERSIEDAPLVDVDGTIAEASEGKISVDLTAENTDLPAGHDYKWQIQVKSDADNSTVKVVMTGKLKIEPTLLEVEDAS